MRSLITGSALFITAMLCVLIHASIVSSHIRDNEVSNGLDKSFDYAMDVMSDIYKSSTYDPNRANEYTTELIGAFCNALNEKIGTDGDLSVQVVQADLQTGTFEIIVTETYDYPIKNRTGSCSYDKVFMMEGN